MLHSLLLHRYIFHTEELSSYIHFGLLCISFSAVCGCIEEKLVDSIHRLPAIGLALLRNCGVSGKPLLWVLLAARSQHIQVYKSDWGSFERPPMALSARLAEWVRERPLCCGCCALDSVW